MSITSNYEMRTCMAIYRYPWYLFISGQKQKTSSQSCSYHDMIVKYFVGYLNTETATTESANSNKKQKKTIQSRWRNLLLANINSIPCQATYLQVFISKYHPNMCLVRWGIEHLNAISDGLTKLDWWLADWLASIRKNRKWNLVDVEAVCRYLCSLIPDFFNTFYCPNSPKRLLQLTLLKRTITLVINSYEFPLFIFYLLYCPNSTNRSPQLNLP